MALKVWLPLNGSLENKGISNIVISDNGPTIADNGKIGKCYYFDNKAITLTSPLADNSAFSVCGWMKLDEGYQTNYGFHLFAIGNNFRCCLSKDNSLFRIVANNATQLGTVETASTITTNTWYHVVVTYGDGTYKIYLNGVLNSQKILSAPNIVNQNAVIGTYTTEKCKGWLNDFRLYDHCLSPLEVKEISQGLVLHYKLDNTAIESSQNLITTQDCFENATCYNGATSKYGYGTTTDIYKTTGTFQGRSCTKVYMGTSGLDAYPYVYFNSFSASGTTVHTLSFDYFPTSQIVLIPYSYNGAYDWNYVVNGVSGSVLNTNTCTYLPVNLNQWNHIEVTAIKTDTTNTNRGIGYIRIGSAKHTSNINNYWLFANVQVEEKDHATAYMGVGGSRTGYAIDSSGYGNNGIINGDIITKTNDNNKGRYSVYTQFNGSNTYINAGKNAKVKDEITVAWWGYMDTWSSYTRAISCTEGGGWNFEPSSGKLNFAMGTGATSNTYKSCTSNTTLASLSSGWHYFVGTYDGLDSKLYIDGVLDRTLNCYTTKTPIFYNVNNNIIIGAEANGSTGVAGSYYNGNLSDVRIYAAALSAEDILDLYHTPANIDNLQNIHSFEFEENGIKTSVYQNGVMSVIDEIHESNAELLNDFISGGYTPTANTQNSCVTLGIVDFTKYASNGEDLAIHIECDLEWTAFTAGTGGTFNGFWWQGANWQLNGTSGVWQGTNYIAQALTSQKTLRNATDSTTAGKYHYNTTVIIPASWFDTYNKSNIGFRCDYSDGVGKITVNNFKATPLQYYNAKIGEDFISANNFIEK